MEGRQVSEEFWSQFAPREIGIPSSSFHPLSPWERSPIGWRTVLSAVHIGCGAKPTVVAMVLEGTS